MPSGILDSTPAADGFRMPAEWAPHQRTYLVWPERPDTWRAGARPAQEAFAAVAAAVSRWEPVTVLASAAERERARAACPPAVRIEEVATDDAWARDTGPTVVVHPDRGERRGVDWVFNAWGGADGGLYAPWDRDDAVAAAVCELEGMDRYRAPLVLEGGSIHVDGEGTCLTTEECLLHPNRNPGLTREEIEAHLRAYLGVSTVVWLPRGVPFDETDGHVDNLACFTRPGRVLLTWTEAADDPRAPVAAAARRVLESATDARGRSLEVVPVPAPGPLAMTAAEAAGVAAGPAKARRAGDPLAASYVNCYLATGAVVVPQLDGRTDDEAADLLAREFPDRHVERVPARELLLGGGGIHCITQQIPAGPAGAGPDGTRG